MPFIENVVHTWVTLYTMYSPWERKAPSTLEGTPLPKGTLLPLLQRVELGLVIDWWSMTNGKRERFLLLSCLLNLEIGEIYKMKNKRRKKEKITLCEYNWDRA